MPKTIDDDLVKLPEVRLIELHTILAALRYYQDNNMADKQNRDGWLDEVADPDDTGGLDRDEIDELCVKLNLS